MLLPSRPAVILSALALFLPTVVLSAEPSTPPTPAIGAELQPSTVAAIVNGKPITVERIDSELKKPETIGLYEDVRSDLASLNRLRTTVLNSVIDRELLLDAARKSAVVKSGEINKAIAQFLNSQGGEEGVKAGLKARGASWDKFINDLADGFRLKQFVERDLAGSVSVTDEDIKRVFETSPERFAAPEMVRARHILIKTAPDADQEKLDEALAKARSVRESAEKKDANFIVLALEHSEDDTTKYDGGELGFFAKGMTVPEFEKAAFEAKSGEIIGPVKTRYGYHIIKVEEHRLEGKPDFDKGKEIVKSALLEQARGRAIIAKLGELRGAVEIKYLVPELVVPPDAD